MGTTTTVHRPWVCRHLATPQTAMTPSISTRIKRTPHTTTPMVTFGRCPLVVRAPRATTDPEQVQAEDQGGEVIIVAIQMRPLNTRESSERRIWKVLPQLKSMTQTTPAGKPLPERITGRSFFMLITAFETTTTCEKGEWASDEDECELRWCVRTKRLLPATKTNELAKIRQMRQRRMWIVLCAMRQLLLAMIRLATKMNAVQWGATTDTCETTRNNDV